MAIHASYPPGKAIELDPTDNELVLDALAVLQENVLRRIRQAGPHQYGRALMLHAGRIDSLLKKLMDIGFHCSTEGDHLCPASQENHHPEGSNYEGSRIVDFPSRASE